MSAPQQDDWTQGADAIVYRSCGACRHIWYFRRPFCPSCGASEPETHRSNGTGAVYSVTVVLRAATPETKLYAPYAMLLVDLAEGFRMMAHGDKDLAIGDRVIAQFRPFANDVLAPYFVRA